jgi:hypothetical protein
MQFEKTEIQITTEEHLQLKDARTIRGFFGNLYKNRPEFHGHKNDGFVYKHPLIQYKIIGEKIVIIGIKEGAYSLKALPTMNAVEIYHKSYKVLEQRKINCLVPFGVIDKVVSYNFLTPWIGLNEENYKLYKGMDNNSIKNFLENILIGNILSMSKALGYVVNKKIIAEVFLERNGIVEVKQGIELMTFIGNFKTNFIIPYGWGIGKFSSRGYGTIISDK